MSDLRKVLEERIDIVSRLFNDRNWEALCDMHTPECRFIRAGKVYSGSTETIENLKQLRMGFDKMDATTKEVEGILGGDNVYCSATYKMKNGESPVYTIKLLYIWKLVDGLYKADIVFSSKHIP
ncbi:uncharacterized protein LOC144345989 [Saccoglossus kowalevskii]